MYKSCSTLRHEEIDEVKLWTDITPSNVSFDKFEQSIGQKLPRIYGVY